MNAKQAAALHEGVSLESISDIVSRIIDELLAKTQVMEYDGKKISYSSFEDTSPASTVTLDEISAIPEQDRPQLTGRYMKVDISSPSYLMLVDTWLRYKQEKHPEKKAILYGQFRQGLDILDLDDITYKMIGMNPCSMGHWLPKLAEAVSLQDFFKIPKTTIIQVPVPLLQLTRCDYMSLTRTTLDIVDGFCRKAFHLDENKDYFIKTGTYSSKFDFRNAKIHGAKEVRELGEYLLFIHFQALQMAAPINHPCLYGVSTTNEWVAREFIPDKENNPCIYHGLPLHTEYRVFVDFDTKDVLHIHPYWDPDVMKKRFGDAPDADTPDNTHDYIIYASHENTLMQRYRENEHRVRSQISRLIQDIHDLPGQWSIDIMQNGDEFWLIDMAPAVLSAFKENIPTGLLKPLHENWIPDLSKKES